MGSVSSLDSLVLGTFGILGNLAHFRHFRHFLLVWVISISNLRFVWNLMLGIWDFKDSVNGHVFCWIKLVALAVRGCADL
jgi:hypothetical protein